MTDIIIPQATKSMMSNLVDKSISGGIELSAPIFPDLSLGETIEGSLIECDYPHVEGAIGLFHTHPIPEPASPRDFMSTLAADDEIMCIGRQKDYLYSDDGAMVGATKEKIVSCFRFRKNHLYFSLQKRAIQLNSRGEAFEDQLRTKYGYVPKRETEFTDDEYDQYRSILDDAGELEKEFEENKSSVIEAEWEFKV